MKGFVIRALQSLSRGMIVVLCGFILSASIGGQVKASAETWIRAEYIALCHKIGKEYGISPEFLIAFIEAESSGNPNASNGKCKGLMQVYESVHRERMREMGITNIYDPESNIRLGASILIDLYEQYGDDTAKIVMMYNGSSNAKARAESGNFTEYANKVLNRTAELEELHGKHDYKRFLQKRQAEDRQRDKMEEL